jgi:hypothetical protein
LNPGGINGGTSAEDFVEGMGDGAVASFMNALLCKTGIAKTAEKGARTAAPLIRICWRLLGLFGGLLVVFLGLLLH